MLTIIATLFIYRLLKTIYKCFPFIHSIPIVLFSIIPQQNKDKPTYPLNELYIITKKYYRNVYEMIATGIRNNKAITKAIKPSMGTRDTATATAKVAPTEAFIGITYRAS